ncbi:hypothetical protein ACOBQX_02815 [Actinokineospora sp. G85]|uniref:hypothetical protein n=1 Tax=Actinokineospora sp. G85 TaxID=3406626 RepID=UPI003C753D4B
MRMSRTSEGDLAGGDEMRTVLLAEYEALKAEQKSRITLRDRLVYTALAALAATLALVLQPVERPNLMLLLPLVCVVLGWTHLANDQKITAIGGYLRDHLAPALRSGGPRAVGILAWESLHRTTRLRRLDKCTQLAVDLMIFAVPSLLATALYWSTDNVRPNLLVVSIIEAVVTLGFAIRIVIAADLRGTSVDDQGPRDSGERNDLTPDHPDLHLFTCATAGRSSTC